jgi:hypothetical protein
MNGRVLNIEENNGRTEDLPYLFLLEVDQGARSKDMVRIRLSKELPKEFQHEYSVSQHFFLDRVSSEVLKSYFLVLLYWAGSEEAVIQMYQALHRMGLSTTGE